MAVKSGVTVTLDKVAHVLEGVRLLTSQQVMVGFPGDDPKVARTGEKSAGLNNAALGYIHEKGAPEANIPARPFLEPGIKAVQNETIDGLKKAGEFALQGRVEAVGRQLHRVGLRAVNSVRAVINAGVPPPLKPSTLAGRRRRGRKGTVPLIDTGQLRNAITYVIRSIK